MALLEPFRALRYDVGAAGPLDELVAPPYDVIDADVQARLLAASPYNAVRLIRPDEPAEAADTLRRWREAGILVREPDPALWLLEEEFVGPDGVARTRRGLVGRVPLAPYERGLVLRHERTFPGPKRARLRLLRATRTKLSPILLLHEGPPPPRPGRPPDLVASYGGATSRLWRLPDGALAETVRAPLVIADGHHRYESALRFHEEERSDETRAVLAALVSREDPGLVVYPTHRVARGLVPELNGRYETDAVAGGPAEGLELLAELPANRAAFVLVRPDRTLLVRAPGVLDSAAVDGLGLEDVSFTASAEEAEAAVRAGGATAAFLVRAPTVEQVGAFARAGEPMPQKTTYFFPKLQSGLLFSPFDE